MEPAQHSMEWQCIKTVFQALQNTTVTDLQISRLNDADLIDSLLQNAQLHLFGAHPKHSNSAQLGLCCLGLKNITIKHLDLSNMGLKNHGCVTVARALNKNKKCDPSWFEQQQHE